MSVMTETRSQARDAWALRTATDADVAPLKGVLAAAFHEDPIFEWLMPDEATRQVRLRRFFELEFGVSPDRQGQGLGSALMRPTLDRCDEEGLPAYLEASSERNAALYERLGFELKDELRFAGSPPLRLMLRPPRTRRST